MVEEAREEENEEGKETDRDRGKGGGKEAQNQMKGRDECVLLFIVLAVWRSR